VAKAARPPRSKAEKEMGKDLTQFLLMQAIVLRYCFFPPCCAAVLQLRDTFDEESIARLRFEF
jgi:hypothetical protein